MSGPVVLKLDNAEIPDRALIGGKAWSVAHMRSLGLPVPAAFVITTECCRAYFSNGGHLPVGVEDMVCEHLAWLEQVTGRTFDGAEQPLLLSVRSGAAISMPGMMDTVLNLGINDRTEDALALETGDPGFGRDTHKRFLETFSKIVMRGPKPNLPDDENPAAWRAGIERSVGKPVPENAFDQLMAAITAVFDSWNTRRARRYRLHHDISDDMGTAVTVQAMVFGNSDENSGTGVLFSRNPLTGEDMPYGEFLGNAQGEDVVSGEFTPEPLDKLAEHFPALHRQLLDAASVLERENRDIQDIEYTIERGKLYLLQSRAAKRAPLASVTSAVAMVREGMINETEALGRVNGDQVHNLLIPHLADGQAAGATKLASGEAACPGLGVGVVVNDADEAESMVAKGHDVVLARAHTSPEDVHGMIVAKAVITEQGGTTSHAAVVSRALGIACVVGCGKDTLAELTGKTVTVDGDGGVVYDGALKVGQPREQDNVDLLTLHEWAEPRTTLEVIDQENGQCPDGILDLDHTEGGEDVEFLAGILDGQSAAKGGALNSSAGVTIAVNAGLQAIGVKQVLPALLAAFAAETELKSKSRIETSTTNEGL